ncbi:hypothetical protein [Agrococcus sp. DT81.2]|uniref:hypothetical protein n=1 Tax=Agrococcus sp. DT81.2 TaxID=3393414 RepID=UPI003CE4E24A
MTDLDALLDEATPAFEDVRICLDGARRAEWNALAEQAMSKDDADGRLGAKSPAAVAKKKLDALADELRERMLTIRVFAVPGTQWAALKSKNPPRKGDRQDEAQGYNLEAVARQALITHGKRVSGDKVEDINAGQWGKILEKIGGGDFQTLIYAVIGVNQLVGQQFVGLLVKGSPATSNSAGK